MTGPSTLPDRPCSQARSRLADAAWLLRTNPRYRRYLAARWTNTAGTTVAPLGLAFAVLAQGGGATGLGVVLAGGPLVYLLVMPVAGVTGDRFARNRIIACCHLVSGTGQSISAALVLTGHAAVWSLALLAMTAGGAAAFLQPAVQGLVQEIVPDPAQLVTAGAVMQIPMNVVAVLGPALAGLAIAGFGPGGVLAWDAATFFIAAALFVSLRLPARGDHRPRTRFRADLRQGLAVFAARRWLRMLAVMSAVSYGCWSAAVTVLGPVYARQQLHGAVGWGIVTSALGLGLACGSLIALLARPHRIGLLMCGATGFSALFMASMASAAPLPAVAVAAVLTGAAGTVQGITWTAYLQSVVPASQIARVASLYALATSALVPLAYLAAGPLASLTGLRPAIWGCTAAETLAGLTAIAIPDVRKLTRHDDQQASRPGDDHSGAPVPTSV
jgi:hypothetical protein